MKEELIAIGEKLVTHKYELAEKIMNQQKEDYKEQLKQTSVDLRKVIEWRSELIQYLGDALINDSQLILDQVKNWAEIAGTIATQKGLPLDEALKQLAIYRSVIWEVFSEELAANKLAAKTMLDVSKIINPILDEVCYIFSSIYVESNNQMMEAANTAIQELSVPVVPFAKKVAVLPLIGEIDTYRAKFIMEVALEKSMNLKLKYLIIDISGVPIVDTMVAHNLFQVVAALRLIGVEPTLTGIRPEIAQTVITLGIDFNEVKIRANVQQALSDIVF